MLGDDNGWFFKVVAVKVSFGKISIGAAVCGNYDDN